MDCMSIFYQRFDQLLNLGCGKTTLTIAAIRDPSVRRHFECIAWYAVSQKPNISEIQSKVFMQLFRSKLSDEAATDVGLGFNELQQGSKGHTFLVCLDDVRKAANSEKSITF